MDDTWMNKAAFFELLARAFIYPTDEVVGALISGDFAAAAQEILEVNGLETDKTNEAIEKLASFGDQEQVTVFHDLRREYTRLFVGAPKPSVSPYAGVWYAERMGIQPLLFVGKESMAIERFMRRCGIGQPKGTNNPLDHISSMLEFTQYLCMERAGVVASAQGSSIPENAYEEFYREHLLPFSGPFSEAVIEQSRSSFFRSTACLLAALPASML
jgi:TorA maturation chaperone TorD